MEKLVSLLEGPYTICVVYGWIQKSERDQVLKSYS